MCMDAEDDVRLANSRACRAVEPECFDSSASSTTGGCLPSSAHQRLATSETSSSSTSLASALPPHVHQALAREEAGKLWREPAGFVVNAPTQGKTAGAEGGREDGKLKTLEGELARLRKATTKKAKIQDLLQSCNLEYDESWTIQKLYNYGEEQIIKTYQRSRLGGLREVRFAHVPPGLPRTSELLQLGPTNCERIRFSSGALFDWRPGWTPYKRRSSWRQHLRLRLLHDRVIYYSFAPRQQDPNNLLWSPRRTRTTQCRRRSRSWIPSEMVMT